MRENIGVFLLSILVILVNLHLKQPLTTVISKPPPRYGARMLSLVKHGHFRTPIGKAAAIAHYQT